MQEDKQDEERTDVAHAEQIDTEDAAAESTVVGQLFLNDATRYIPAKEQAGEEAAERQEYLTAEIVEPVE